MKRIWKIYKGIAIAAFSLILLDLVVVLFFGFYRPQIKPADAIVVLGAAINTPALYNRSLQGLKLYQEGDAKIMVLSGGRISDKDISEAGYMRKVIESNSKQPVPLILEEESHSTYENLKNTKAKIGSEKSLVIVSDQYHLARAVIMAKREGFGPVYWSSPEAKYYKNSELAFYYLRELVAMFAYLPKFVFG
ncbi:MAG: YdcF family protein [Patescibacteria group bacterium]